MIENLWTIGSILTIITAIISAVVWAYRRHKNKPTRILFVDDEIDDFAIPKTLKKNDYEIDTLQDVENLHDTKVKNAKIIFVDFKGVGKSFGRQQGIDLIKALKKEYKRKKTVILFSSHNFNLTKEIDAGDDRIAKNASLQDFIDIIKKYS